MNTHPFRRPGIALAAAAFAGVLSAAGSVRAQQQTFHLDRLEVPGAPDDGVVLFRPRARDHAIFYAQLGLGLAVDPLRTGNITNVPSIQRVSAGNVITDQISTYMSVGVEFLHRFTAGLTFPSAWIEGGNQPRVGNGLVPVGATTAFSTTGPAIGDTRLDLRGMVWTSEDEQWSIGAGLGIFLPTGSSDNFGGDGSVSWLPMIDGEWTPPKLPLPLTFVANTGIHIRPENGVNDPGGQHGPPEGLGIGNEWRWAVGALMPIADRYRVGLTIFGQTGLTNDSTVGNTVFNIQNTPIEWNAEGRMNYPIAGALEHLFFGASVGTRLTDGYGGPDFRMVLLAGSYWSIEDTNPPNTSHKLRGTIHESQKDTDGDGIPDDVDACPTVPEDHKEPDPSDGCPAPDVDTDKDGIVDAQDACPKEPGQPDPDPKQNGCPKHIRLEGSSVRVLQQVHFQTASATILPDSFPMLTELSQLLKVNPDIKHMMIEGHTDNHGNADYNLDLSKRRAASVRQWLIDHGVEGDRLQSEGYGLTRPVASNDTDEGRAQNRRVEFKILDEDADKPKSQ
jgi:outer membrane protein OmpA-like peptidoglycan-associated protein